MPLLLLRTALLTVAAAGTLAAPAAADTFCVGTDGCAPTVQAALDAAAAHPGFDEVHIGPGTYAGPFTYLPADPAAAGLVHIVGAGPSATKLTYGGTGTALRLGVETSKVKSLAISAPGGTALELPDFGTAGDLDITARTGLRFDSAAGRVAGIDRTRIV
ncbi:MAG TPA: hypothetical protein VD836_09105, partial [Solirubrobacteraceae bacterium]|nr:hypothetical protein [Solirubrobacteraceae bacterium]